MISTIHSYRSKILCDHIRELRMKAGMTQRDLAVALGREHGMVARIELGERRVDLVEAYDLFIALHADPAKEAAALMKKFAADGQIERHGSSSTDSLHPEPLRNEI